MKGHTKIKAYIAMQNEEKIPRKIKKHLIGKRVSKKKLKEMLRMVKIISTAKTMYENPNIFPYEFCPHCGCTHSRGTGNMTEYPEHWERFHCVRCGELVAYIDNSPYVHALECEDYDPTI
jgi:transcription initiation factor IIE alpha subunit